MKKQITFKDFEDAARELQCDVFAIQAVAEVESRGAGFYADGTPVILFESHVFGRLTQYKYNSTHPNISTRNWDKKTYGPSSRQHGRLQVASALDRNAALQSASWGKFQIMGFNWKACGYKDLQDFINAMYRSEADHLKAFVGFIKHHPNMHKAIQHLDFTTFAKLYNGPGYAQNRYHILMQQAYNKYKTAHQKMIDNAEEFIITTDPENGAKIEIKK